MKINKGCSAPPLTLFFLIMADINECSLNNPSHDCEQICINTNGGFKCSCTEQYVLANDSRSCEGINNTYYKSQSGIWRDISRAGGHIFTSRRRVKI